MLLAFSILYRSVFASPLRPFRMKLYFLQNILHVKGKLYLRQSLLLLLTLFIVL